MPIHLKSWTESSSASDGKLVHSLLLHSGGLTLRGEKKIYIVLPLICHLQERASVICEITLFVWDGCTFCSFRSDNDLEYVNLAVCLSLLLNVHYIRLGHSWALAVCLISVPDKSLNSLICKVIKSTYRRTGGSDTPFVEWAPVWFAVIHEIIRQWERKLEALPSILFFIVSVQFCSCGFIAPWEVSGADLPSIVSQLLFCVGASFLHCNYSFCCHTHSLFWQTNSSSQMLPGLQITIRLLWNVIALLRIQTQ